MARRTAATRFGDETVVELSSQAGPAGVTLLWTISKPRRGGLRELGRGESFKSAMKAASDKQARGEK